MPKHLVEAALFVADRPLKVEELSKATGVNVGHVAKVLGELQGEYEGRALEIAETPEGWHMRVRHDVLPRVAHLTPHSDLTEGCKRTLALILYKEPVKQSEIIKIQGNKAYEYIKKLQKKGLVKAVSKGHTKILELTQEFESYFGERKESLKSRLQQELGHAGGTVRFVNEAALEAPGGRAQGGEREPGDLEPQPIMPPDDEPDEQPEPDPENEPDEEKAAKVVDAILSGKSALPVKKAPAAPEAAKAKEKLTKGKGGKSLVWTRGK